MSQFRSWALASTTERSVKVRLLEKMLIALILRVQKFNRSGAGRSVKRVSKKESLTEERLAKVSELERHESLWVGKVLLNFCFPGVFSNVSAFLLQFSSSRVQTPRSFFRDTPLPLPQPGPQSPHSFAYQPLDWKKSFTTFFCSEIFCSE